mmetsp:Transcript_70428/g.152990  ORF Transcript_70428/g.152990 Transcript_70428/m.152990 type:complete len:101 (+) Transcript_70428:74-376(+)
MPQYPEEIEYSEKYADDQYEYRHVSLPLPIASMVMELTRQRPSRMLTEDEWRGLGVQQSLGWVHYGMHRPEPHILLFRRVLGTDGTTGAPPPMRPQQTSM